jgi:hypothetical protein
VIPSRRRLKRSRRLFKFRFHEIWFRWQKHAAQGHNSTFLSPFSETGVDHIFTRKRSSLSIFCENTLGELNVLERIRSDKSASSPVRSPVGIGMPLPLRVLLWALPLCFVVLHSCISPLPARWKLTAPFWRQYSRTRTAAVGCAISRARLPPTMGPNGRLSHR